LTDAADNLVRADMQLLFGGVMQYWSANTVGGAIGYFGVNEVYNKGAYGGFPNWVIPAFQGNFISATFGFCWDMGLGLDAASTTAHQVVRDHFYKYPVGMLGDTTGWCYQKGGRYSAIVGTTTATASDFGGGSGTWTYSASWGAAFSLAVAAGAETATACAANGVLDGGNYPEVTSYWGNLQPAISYAVDHLATGALAAYGRQIAASNWQAFINGTANTPEWTVAPRVAVGLPSWVPAAGTFVNLGASTLMSIRPTGWPTSEGAGPFANWCGGAFNPDFGTRGGYVIHGSGHLTLGTPVWAGVWVFDLETLQWVGRNVPAQPLIEAPPGATYNSFYESTVPATLGHPYAPHTYDGLAIRPASAGGGAQGSLLRFGMAGAGIANPRVVHQFDLSSATAPPTRIVDNLAGISTSYPMTAVDPSRNGVWALSYNGNGTLSRVSFANLVVTTFVNASFNEYGDYTLTYLPAPYDALVATGRSGSGGVNWGYYVLSCANPSAGWTNFTARVGGTPHTNTGAGTCWSTLLNTLVSYGGKGSTVVHKLNPPAPGSLTTGNWTWTSETLTAVAGAVPANCNFNTHYGRFLEAPSLRCFIWADSVNQPTQAWRLVGM